MFRCQNTDVISLNEYLNYELISFERIFGNGI